MIQVFETSGKNLIELDTDFTGGINLQNKWIHMENPTDLEIELIARLSGVDEDLIKAALDEDERSRIEVEDDVSLVLFDVPVIEEEEEYYSYNTIPLGVITTKVTIMTICLKPNSVIRNFINSRVKNFSTAERNRFLYQLLYTTHVKYLQYLRQIDRSYQRIQIELHQSTKNKELIQLLDLENSLVYFSTSLRGNNLVIERLARQVGATETEYNNEIIDNAIIESRQALDMCNIYRDVLSGTMDAYASIISNNLNITMRLLTIISVIMAVPTIFASLWGMNTGVPLQGKWWGFWVVVAISAIASIVAFVLLRRNERLRFDRKNATKPMIKKKYKPKNKKK